MSKEVKKRMKWSIDCSQDGMTKQSFEKECNINHIVSRYVATGQIQHVNNRQPQYGDVSDPLVSDYQSQMDAVVRGNEAFENLPEHIRSQFDSPQDFFDWAQDEANEQDMIDAGLRKPKSKPEPEPKSKPELKPEPKLEEEKSKEAGERPPPSQK